MGSARVSEIPGFPVKGECAPRDQASGPEGPNPAIVKALSDLLRSLPSPLLLQLVSQRVREDESFQDLASRISKGQISESTLVSEFQSRFIDPLTREVDILTKSARGDAVGAETIRNLGESYARLLNARKQLLESLRGRDPGQVNTASKACATAACDVSLVDYVCGKINSEGVTQTWIAPGEETSPSVPASPATSKAGVVAEQPLQDAIEDWGRQVAVPVASLEAQIEGMKPTSRSVDAIVAYAEKCLPIYSRAYDTFGRYEGTNKRVREMNTDFLTAYGDGVAALQECIAAMKRRDLKSVDAWAGTFANTVEAIQNTKARYRDLLPAKK